MMSVWFAWIVPVYACHTADIVIYIALFHSKKCPRLDGKFYGHAAQGAKNTCIFSGGLEFCILGSNRLKYKHLLLDGLFLSYHHA